jgi:hypothetical protein
MSFTSTLQWPISRLPANLQKATPNVTGALRFSDLEGARLLAAAAEEAAGGLMAGLNPIAESDATFLTGVSTESKSFHIENRTVGG